jgi:hypothetical protein
MQLGNSITETFFIMYYTYSVVSTFQNASFENLMYDLTMNSYELMPPYFPNPYPYPILAGINSPPLDQVDIFEQLHQCMMTLHRMT